MTSRVLPFDEWGRLDGTDLEELAATTTPEHARMLVVERDGEIVGHCALVLIMHAAGAWVAPAHRKRGVVAGRLLALLKSVGTPHASGVVVSRAPDETKRLLVKHCRATVFPAEEHTLVPLH